MKKERYEEATSDVLDMVKENIENVFPDLRDAEIYCVFDLKKRKSGGRIILATIKKSNNLIKFLTISNLKDNGYDYILFVDKVFWDFASDTDKNRVIRHELQHCEVDPESEKDPFKLRDHEVQDFYEEIEKNKEDPRWAQRCVSFVEARYEQMKEEEKIAKKSK